MPNVGYKIWALKITVLGKVVTFNFMIYFVFVINLRIIKKYILIYFGRSNIIELHWDSFEDSIIYLRRTPSSQLWFILGKFLLFDSKVFILMHNQFSYFLVDITATTKIPTTTANNRTYIISDSFLKDYSRFTCTSFSLIIFVFLIHLLC